MKKLIVTLVKIGSFFINTKMSIFIRVMHPQRSQTMLKLIG